MAQKKIMGKNYGSKIWELLPSNIIDSENLNIFKSNIKSWKPENYPCRWRRL